MTADRHPRELMGASTNSTLRAPGSACPTRILTLTQTYGVVTVEEVVRNRFFSGEAPYRVPA
jgi:hypothetical protein